MYVYIYIYIYIYICMYVKIVDQKKTDDRRQSMQQNKSKRASGEGVPGGKIVKG